MRNAPTNQRQIPKSITRRGRRHSSSNAQLTTSILKSAFIAHTGLTVAHLIPTRSSKLKYPTAPFSARLLFRHVLSRLILASMADDTVQAGTVPSAPGLKKIAPYWYPYTTMAKGRWLGREILEMVSTEFRDRSMEYYVSCLVSFGRETCPDTHLESRDTLLNLV